MYDQYVSKLCFRSSCQCWGGGGCRGIKEFSRLAVGGRRCRIGETRHCSWIDE